MKLVNSRLDASFLAFDIQGCMGGLIPTVAVELLIATARCKPTLKGSPRAPGCLMRSDVTFL